MHACAAVTTHSISIDCSGPNLSGLRYECQGIEASELVNQSARAIQYIHVRVDQPGANSDRVARRLCHNRDIEPSSKLFKKYNHPNSTK